MVRFGRNVRSGRRIRQDRRSQGDGAADPLALLGTYTWGENVGNDYTGVTLDNQVRPTASYWEVNYQDRADHYLKWDGASSANTWQGLMKFDLAAAKMAVSLGRTISAAKLFVYITLDDVITDGEFEIWTVGTDWSISESCWRWKAGTTDWDGPTQDRERVDEIYMNMGWTGPFTNIWREITSAAFLQAVQEVCDGTFTTPTGWLNLVTFQWENKNLLWRSSVDPNTTTRPYLQLTFV